MNTTRLNYYFLGKPNKKTLNYFCIKIFVRNKSKNAE